MNDLALDIYNADTSMHAIQVDALVKAFGIDARTWLRLRVGWHESGFVFPLVDPLPDIVNYEVLSSERWPYPACPESGGVLLPDGVGQQPIVVITQGAANVAALLDMGFDAIGLPYNGCRVDEVRVMLAERPGWHEVVLLEERTKPGTNISKATRALYAELQARLASGHRKVYSLRPPVGVNNAYAWLKKGATEDDVMAVIDAEKPRTVGRFDWLKRRESAA
jgi:hypothetical protein